MRTRTLRFDKQVLNLQVQKIIPQQEEYNEHYLIIPEPCDGGAIRGYDQWFSALPLDYIHINRAIDSYLITTDPDYGNIAPPDGYQLIKLPAFPAGKALTFTVHFYESADDVIADAWRAIEFLKSRILDVDESDVIDYYPSLLQAYALLDYMYRKLDGIYYPSEITQAIRDICLAIISYYPQYEYATPYLNILEALREAIWKEGTLYYNFNII